MQAEGACSGHVAGEAGGSWAEAEQAQGLKAKVLDMGTERAAAEGRWG